MEEQVEGQGEIEVDVDVEVHDNEVDIEVEIEEEGHRHRLVVTVHNEDEGGEPFKIPGEPETLVEKTIETVYIDLGITRQDGDRLFCLANGDDVFPHAHQRLGEYANDVCRALEWGFSRPTGGA